MTITSININPGNESKYARHRSIWKGKHNKLAETVAKLQATRGMQVHQFLGKTFEVETQLANQFGVRLKASRRAPKRGEIMGQWVIDPPSAKLVNAVPGTLRGDLSLLWSDFITVSARRIGFSSGAGASNDSHYTGQSLVVIAIGPHSFDLITSKYGYAEHTRKNHHFFQWQARTAGFDGLVAVDDYAGEEGLTFYVAA